MDDQARAKAGYEGYAAFTGGKTFDGREMPTWDALPQRIRDAWAAAVEAIRKGPTEDDALHEGRDHCG